MQLHQLKNQINISKKHFKSMLALLISTATFSVAALGQPIVQSTFVKQYFNACLEQNLDDYIDIHYKSAETEREQWQKYMSYFCSDQHVSDFFGVKSKADINLSDLRVSVNKMTANKAGVIAQLNYKGVNLPKSLVLFPSCNETWKIGRAIDNPKSKSIKPTPDSTQ